MPGDSKIDAPLKRTPADTVHAFVRAATSAVPVAGGPLTELFAYLIQEPVSKRRDAWIVEIAGRLRTLEDQLGRPLAEELKQDEGFTTLLLGATQVAMRNHKAEKIAALSNAVMNTAIGIAPEETERSIMLDLVDRMTAQHLAILQLLHSKRINDFVATMYEAFPALQGREDLVRINLA